MSDREISQEAKTTLANASRRKAADRLRRDGCQSMDAVRRRVRAVAEERQLQPAEYAKLMHKRISTAAAVDFCDKHKISMDWLLCGDLKGLQRMTRDARAEPAARLPTKDFVALYSLLSIEQKQMITAFLKELIARQRREPEPQHEAPAPIFTGSVTASGSPRTQGG